MTKQFSNYSDLLTFTRASKGHALRPVSYGDELVTNGTFDSDASGWTAGGGANPTVSVSSGQAVLTATQTGSIVFEQTTAEFEAGKLYQIKVDVVTTTDNISVWNKASSSINISALSTGTNVINYVATEAGYLRFGNLGAVFSTGEGFTLDNITVKEVTFDQPDGTLTLFEHPVNVPRVEWDSAGNRLGLLVEEARTNLERYSDFSSDWASLDSTEVQNAIAPDGTETAFTVTRDSTSYGGFFFYNAGTNISVTSGSTYSISIYLKQGEMGNVTSFLLKPDNSGVGGSVVSGAVTITPQTDGSFSLSDDFDASSESVGNGWYRVSLSFTATTTGTAQYGLVSSGSSNFPLNSSILVWGAQFEAGSFPTSYIKTTGATATRSADVASIPTADFGYNHKEGTILVEGDYKFNTSGSGYPRIIELGNTTTSQNRIVIYMSEAGNDAVYGPLAANVQQASINLIADETDGVFEASKMAIVFAENNFIGVTDGAVRGTDTSGTIVPSEPRDTLAIGRQAAGYSSIGTGHFKTIKYYPRALTAAQLQEITT